MGVNDNGVYWLVCACNRGPVLRDQPGPVYEMVQKRTAVRNHTTHEKRALRASG